VIAIIPTTTSIRGIVIDIASAHCDRWKHRHSSAPFINPIVDIIMVHYVS
jgi:hypothetical protein